MKIGLFTDTYAPHINGVATSVLMLKNALEKQGHQVYVVTVNSENNNINYDVNNRILRIPGLKTGIYDYVLTKIYPLKALKKIKNWNLDIIHTHTEFGVGTFARIISKQFNIPLVHTYHTMYEEYINCITKGYINELGNKMVEYLTTFYCDKTISELIVPTQKTKDLFKNKYKIKRDIHIIPTGIEIEKFSKNKFSKNVLNTYRRKYNLDSDDFIILYLGRLGKEKNIDFLIDCHRYLVKKNKKYKLLIVGDGPEMKHLKKLVIKYKINENTIFVGKVQWDVVPIYYQITDIFATSSKTETQGLTVIEALASSKPILCIADDSYKNVIIDNVNGRIFRNKKEYLKIINELFNNKNELDKLGEKAIESAQIHSTKYFANSVLEIYKLAINKNPKISFLVYQRIKDVLKWSLLWKK